MYMNDGKKAADPAWGIGAVVRLVSGGPAMTITHVPVMAAPTSYGCSWFVDGECRHASFPGAALRSSQPESDS